MTTTKTSTTTTTPPPPTKTTMTMMAQIEKKIKKELILSLSWIVMAIKIKSISMKNVMRTVIVY